MILPLVLLKTASVLTFHVGVFYEAEFLSSWPFELSLRYFYPFFSDPTFTLKSDFPLGLQSIIGLKHEVTPDLEMGLFGQVDYLDMDLLYSGGMTDYSFLVTTLSFRLYLHY